MTVTECANGLLHKLLLLRSPPQPHASKRIHHHSESQWAQIIALSLAEGDVRPMAPDERMRVIREWDHARMIAGWVNMREAIAGFDFVACTYGKATREQ